jgi:hypothetical protein
MTAYISVAEKVNRATVLNSDIGPSAVLSIYTGGIPALINGDLGTVTGTLLATMPCSSGSFGSVSASNAGVVQITAGAITQVNATATGTAGTARLSKSGGIPVMDMDVTATGGGGALQLNTMNIVSGGPIIIASFVITEG